MTFFMILMMMIFLMSDLTNVNYMTSPSPTANLILRLTQPCDTQHCFGERGGDDPPP